MTLLPLDTWFELLGFNRWHAFGFSDSELLSTASQHCQEVIFETAPQSADGIGREDIREAIATAEDLVYRIASFYPAPKFYEVEKEIPRLADRRFKRSGSYNADFSWNSITLQDSWIQDAGIEGLTAIQVDAGCIPIDVNSDGYPEYFEIGPIATTVTDAREITVYFSANDRWDGSGVGESWRIDPIVATISGGFVTIRIKPWLLGRPVLSIGIQPSFLDARDWSNFASSVDVYRRFVDRTGITTDTSQGVVIWETRPCHGWWCCCSACGSASLDAYSGSPYDPRATAQAVARVGIRNPQRGVVTPAEATYNATTGTWSAFPSTLCAEPDRVLLRLYAGYPLGTDGQMDRKMRTIVARLAAAELQQSICGCAEAKRRVLHWQQDLSKIGADKEVYAISPEQLDNPLGTRRGHWWAFSSLVDFGRMKGRRV